MVGGGGGWLWGDGGGEGEGVREGEGDADDTDDDDDDDDNDDDDDDDDDDDTISMRISSVRSPAAEAGRECVNPCGNGPRSTSCTGQSACEGLKRSMFTSCWFILVYTGAWSVDLVIYTSIVSSQKNCKL